MIIPWQQLQPDTLTSLIKEFVTRDGTDYGYNETSLDMRIEQVRAKLSNGEAVVLFSQSTGLCNIVARDRL
ncbi:YheU family protein [Amphritea sp. 1_MG-2023]|uniref:YheU family protein n=1 Tax=Amphritea sp. 1_MG-2023 TaxID=3062670 RepID=UPI0026E263A9|nr:YheU family protein [Amphritea sp. 1_MG-2023]MDO6564008.1 YheU family protein [Amphritea sp. 1_MG-2023]